MPIEVPHMKWWGWGVEGSSFEISGKPGLFPYLKRELGVTDEQVTTPPVPLADVRMPERKLNGPFEAALEKVLRADQIRNDRHERLIHAFGKSYRDLWRVRRGEVERAPDLIIYPESEQDVVAVMAAALEHSAVIIPFGGGSNIAGCLEPRDKSGRYIVSLDMGRMDRVLSVDKDSLIARIQPGGWGMRMENQLREHDVTLGHFPDSFLYSTLGGWIATRSAGMQSDVYGKIEDMVVALRMVTPAGTIITRTVPKCSNGIDVKQLCIGSEGILGVITEATMRVHPLPESRKIYGYLFPDFESGAAALKECTRLNIWPVIARLNDPKKTALSFAFKGTKTPFKALLTQVVKWWIHHVKGIDFTKCCMMIVAFEGDSATVERTRLLADGVYCKHGAAGLGTEPGRGFEKAKFDFPHLRDFVMDRNIMADVSETATTWANLLPFYRDTKRSIEQAITDTGSLPWVGCHISHNYHTGASLYFTFGCRQCPGREMEQYLYVKKAAEDAFMRNGGTLSHHHAVGTEHLPWVEADISPAGVRAVRALKDGIDPKNIMNPGKIIPSDQPLADWGLSGDSSKLFSAGK